MAIQTTYLKGTQHPWPSLLVLAPLLVVYETGVLFLGGAHPEALRNGADHWLRYALRAIGLSFFWIPPLVLLLVFAIWTLRRWRDRPHDLTEVISGILLESVIYSLGLWVVSRGLAPLMEGLGIPLAVAAGMDTALQQIVPYLGAGIYEEALFRLALFSALVWLLKRVDLSDAVATILAAFGSATLFSAAHHVGPYGQAYGNYLFTFRLLAGFYFALLFEYRGFGVAVTTHACYNVMVSVGV
jgi:hypothetical protein